ncbi:16S rRNA (uracil(1498)-N(3))-methyltransferase [Anaerovoracaceae bacterium 41-7]|uniref:RsmE family RNA methyltransferase n=1 Tax=Anaerovoracaceae TaxID=543314 RepID=UPI001379A09E|nr:MULTISPECIES: 16S rRNA (uracil(1498)-N(3))-methyltransferase [Clostridia]MCI9476762.1 16S rRNA (uracil(1498)-N(3))-methyltransferase [Emergencia sp.]MCI9639657.1 16S rRNA (uracil(1498)-N(3))-methyltransferase [Emergencia sp.]
MKIFTDAANIEESLIRITDKGDIRHMIKVMRMKEGDMLDVSDSTEWEYQAEILSIDEDLVLLSVLDKQKFAREPRLQVTLFQGVPKAGKMETIIQKCVELGVSSVVPVFMDRTVVVEKGNFAKKLERWQKVADEAVKQCKRGVIPSVCQQIKFAEIGEQLAEFDLVLFPYENEENYSIKDCLRGLSENPQSVAIVIGPEGGFSDKEAALMKEWNTSCVTLGKTILRTETAGMAALAMTMYELEL